MIDQQRQCLQKLLNDPSWEAVIMHIEERIKKLNTERRVKNTEWETARLTVANEAKVEELKQFQKDLEFKAFAKKEE